MIATPRTHSIEYEAVFQEKSPPLCKGNIAEKDVSSEIAQAAIQGLSKFILAHTNDENDKLFASNTLTCHFSSKEENEENDGLISTLSAFRDASFTRETIIQLMKKYKLFIKVLDDSELCLEDSTPLIYCEFKQKIHGSNITATYNRYVFNNPGIAIEKISENTIAFPVFAISKKANTALKMSQSCNVF